MGSLALRLGAAAANDDSSNSRWAVRDLRVLRLPLDHVGATLCGAAVFSDIRDHQTQRRFLRAMLLVFPHGVEAPLHAASIGRRRAGGGTRPVYRPLAAD